MAELPGAGPIQVTRAVRRGRRRHRGPVNHGETVSARNALNA